jgi:integrase
VDHELGAVVAHDRGDLEQVGAALWAEVEAGVVGLVVDRESVSLLDAAGRRRSPATLPGFRTGRPPRNKGFRYPPDPPRVEEIVAVMRQAGETDHGLRLRALIVVLWRAGLRICKAMALTEPDLDTGRGSVLIRQGKGGKRREVGTDDWGLRWSAHDRRGVRVTHETGDVSGRRKSVTSDRNPYSR